MKNVKFVLLLVVALLASYPVYLQAAQLDISTAVAQHAKKAQVEGVGNVIKILPDDNDGTRHQKFIVMTPDGISLLIAHNIDIADRVENLKRGDTVSFSGEYIWNEKGGVIHWTHHDPGGRHQSGWLKHKGATYQ